jgi:ribose 1,5-bisphosphokinase PhnN
MGEKIFIGVAWPYASGPRHLGHVAGAYVPADIFARFQRTKGNESPDGIRQRYARHAYYYQGGERRQDSGAGGDPLSQSV